MVTAAYATISAAVPNKQHPVQRAILICNRLNIFIITLAMPCSSNDGGAGHGVRLFLRRQRFQQKTCVNNIFWSKFFF